MSLAHAPAVPLDVFDARGRRIATLAPETAAAATRWRFGGTDGAGRKVEPGVLFARPRGVAHATARIVVLP